MNVFDKPSAEPNKVRAMPRREKVHGYERFRQAECRDELVRSMPSGEKVHKYEPFGNQTASIPPEIPDRVGAVRLFPVHFFRYRYKHTAQHRCYIVKRSK